MNQYPLHMGKTQTGPGSAGTLALQTNDQGAIRYDLVLHQGKNLQGKVIQTSYQDLVPQDIPTEGYAKPTEEEIQATTEKTKAALEKIVDCKEYIFLDFFTLF
jgi:SNW domain-containing protein 1